MSRVEFTVKMPIKIAKKEGIYISCCPALDLYSQGDTITAAKGNLIEAVQLFITSCYERGTLGAVMRDCGFKPSIRTRKVMPTDHRFITVPIPFSVTGCHEPAACHA